MTTLEAFILSARALVGDGPADNFARLENLNNPDIGNNINGTQKIFNLQNAPIPDEGVFQVIADGTTVQPAAVDTLHGQLTLTIAPITSLQASYYYYYFSDATWTEFVTSALQNLGYSINGPTVDVPTVPEGLLPATKLYTAYGFAMRVASQTATWYNQKLQERDEMRDSISGKWLKLAAQYRKDGDTARNDFYSGGGTQLKPSFKILEHEPTNYTPSR